MMLKTKQQKSAVRQHFYRRQMNKNNDYDKDY